MGYGCEGRDQVEGEMSICVCWGGGKERKGYLWEGVCVERLLHMERRE